MIAGRGMSGGESWVEVLRRTRVWHAEISEELRGLAEQTDENGYAYYDRRLGEVEEMSREYLGELLSALPEVSGRAAVFTGADLGVVEEALGDAWAYHVGEADPNHVWDADDRASMERIQALAEKHGLKVKW